MDLDTFLTTLYVYIDDWYEREMKEKMKRSSGPAPKLSDSEVLTLAIVSQWRKGVPWDSERGLVRYMQQAGRCWFPKMLSRSRFNERVRLLWGAVIELQQALARDIESVNSSYEVVDCLPVPSCSNAQSRRKGHWLWWGMRGHGGTQGQWYWGDQAIVSVREDYVITGWLIGASDVDDRVMLQALLSIREGEYEFKTPEPWRPWRKLNHPSFVIPKMAAGRSAISQRYLADKGFNGYRWHNHWYMRYGISVLTEASRNLVSKQWSRNWEKWFRGLRQKVETTFAVLTTTFGIKRLNAHSRWGQITRFALATAGFNWGIYLNRSIGRDTLSHATILL